MESVVAKYIFLNYPMLISKDLNNRSVTVVHILIFSLDKLNKDEANLKLDKLTFGTSICRIA